MYMLYLLLCNQNIGCGRLYSIGGNRKICWMRSRGWLWTPLVDKSSRETLMREIDNCRASDVYPHKEYYQARGGQTQLTFAR